jgi:hypothetical protein
VVSVCADRETIEFFRRRGNTRAVMLIALVLAPCLAPGKRTAPEQVAPVVHEGIRYVVPNDDRRRGYIEAWDVQTNKKLWDLTVFTNRIDPNLEEDVQWVFIKALSIRDGKLIVTTERGATYQIDLKTRVITKGHPEPSPRLNAAAENHNIPERVQSAIANRSLTSNYDLSFKMNSFYRSGDFDGDGNIDVAVLVKQRSTGKLGIAIVHGAKEKVTILGAGTALGNGGDDFAWMDFWQFIPSEAAAAQQPHNTHAPHIRADALLVGKSEAASALIYWNGKRYVWVQQGD